MKEIYEYASIRELLAAVEAEGLPEFEKYRKMRQFIQFKARPSRTPVSGSFELTPLCNLDCKMCYVHLSKEQMGEEQLLPLDFWLRVADEAIRAGMMYVQLTGGECLTYPEFKELYLYLRSRGVEVTVRTNGLLLQGEMRQFLLDNPPPLLGVTIYGASDDGYEAVTGKRVFHQVMNNVLMMKNAGIPIAVSVTPNAYMQDGKELLHLLHEHNMIWSINPYLQKPRVNTHRMNADATWDTYIDILRCSAELTGKPIYADCEMDDIPEAGGNALTGDIINCGAGKSGFAVDWRGVLQPCINFSDIEFDLNMMSFPEAWAKIGEEIKNYPAPVECIGCAFRSKCHVCVVAHRDGADKGHVNFAICERRRYLVQHGIEEN